jgi:hypothetical protein
MTKPIGVELPYTTVPDTFLKEELKRAQSCYDDDIADGFLKWRGVMSVGVAHYLQILRELDAFRKEKLK